MGVGERLSATAGSDKGGRIFKKVEKAREEILLQKVGRPADSLILAQWDSFWISDL